jgi:DNA-binding GntR family transcriptional regulator
MARLSETAKRVRRRIMDQVLAEGTCPKMAEISRELALGKGEIDAILRDLEAAICVAVQKDTHAQLDSFQEEKLQEPVPAIGEIFSARPFAACKNHYPIWVGCHVVAPHCTSETPP